MGFFTDEDFVKVDRMKGLFEQDRIIQDNTIQAELDIEAYANQIISDALKEFPNAAKKAGLPLETINNGDEIISAYRLCSRKSYKDVYVIYITPDGGYYKRDLSDKNTVKKLCASKGEYYASIGMELFMSYLNIDVTDVEEAKRKASCFIKNKFLDALAGKG